MSKKDVNESSRGLSAVGAQTLAQPIKTPAFMVDGNDLLAASLAACVLNWREWSLWALALGSLNTLSAALLTGGQSWKPESFTVWASWALLQPLAAVSAFRFLEARSRRAMPDRTSLLHLNVSILLTVSAIELTGALMAWTLPKVAGAIGFGPISIPFILVFAMAALDTVFVIAEPLVILGGKAPLDALFSATALASSMPAVFVAGLALQLFIESFSPAPGLLMGWPAFVYAQAKLGPGYALAYIVYAQRRQEERSAL